MPWGAAIGAAAGLAGSAMTASATKDAAANQGSPWSGAKPYVTDSYSKARNAIDTSLGMGTYQGQYTADMNPWQTQGLDTAANYAETQGMQGANTVFGAGMNNIGSASQFGTNAGTMFGQAQNDPTQQIIGNAGQYADNPYLNGQIDAASRDVTRNLNENQLTALDAGATGSGNMNSTRAGVAAGIMQRGAADRIADISSNMRGAAYNNGLGMAQSQYNTGFGQQLNANGQLLQAGQFGADQIGNGLNLGYGAGDVMTRSGAAYQAQQQNTLNGQKQQFTDQQNNGLDLIGKYNSIISGNFNGQATPVTNTFGNVASGAMAGLGLYGKWNESHPANTPTTGSTYGGMNDSMGSTGDYSSPGMDYSGYA